MDDGMVPVVYIGAVWLSLTSYTQLNKVLAEKNPNFLLVGLNFGVTVASFFNKSNFKSKFKLLTRFFNSGF